MFHRAGVHRFVDDSEVFSPPNRPVFGSQRYRDTAGLRITIQELTVRVDPEVAWSQVESFKLDVFTRESVVNPGLAEVVDDRDLELIVR